jgi:tetratricopeptide (TPR) repeat protein
MARKKRLQEVKETEFPKQEEPKEPVMYRDAFQEKAYKQIDDVSKKFEGKGRNLLYILGGIALLAIVIGIFVTWSRRSGGAAQAALGKAIETSQALVSKDPVPPTFTGKSFKSEKERSEAAIAEFQQVASAYGSPVREKALYFAAVTKMNVDRAAAIQELDGLSKQSGEVGALAKFALAQAKQGDGKLDEAAALYSELEKLSDPILSKDTINLQLASIYEKQGKKAEAVDIYFRIADAASKAKDSEGNKINPAAAARTAKDKLEALDPAKAKEIKEEPSTVPAP